MTQEKHTPGPWIREGISINRVYEDGQYTVARVANDHMPETEANARLIAAAPDLLEALERLISLYATNACYDNARAVIRKARGEA